MNVGEPSCPGGPRTEATDDATLPRPRCPDQPEPGAPPGETVAALMGDMGRAFGTIGCRKGDWTVEITTSPIGTRFR